MAQEEPWGGGCGGEVERQVSLAVYFYSIRKFWFLSSQTLDWNLDLCSVRTQVCPGISLVFPGISFAVSLGSHKSFVPASGPGPLKRARREPHPTAPNWRSLARDRPNCRSRSADFLGGCPPFASRAAFACALRSGSAAI